MENPKENPRHSFVEKESTTEDKLEDSLSEQTEVHFRYEEDRKKEMSHLLQLNMETTREEFEVLYTRL